MSDTQSDNIHTTLAKFTGIVKWFNNKTGFGFITALDGDHKSKDIFTHYSNITSTITSTNSLYKYLVQGEYVTFSVIDTKNEKHEFQSVGITGIMDGPLMCETRSLNSSSTGRSERPNIKSTKLQDKPPINANSYDK
jgi:cold shock CspA family protein